MAQVFKGSHSFTCTLLTERTIPAIAFPGEDGTHLPTPEEWKAELALGSWLVTYRNKCPTQGTEPDTVAHLSTNQAQHRLTSLIEANALTITPDHRKQEMQLGIESIFLAAAGFVQCYALPGVHADKTRLNCLQRQRTVHHRMPLHFRPLHRCNASLS